MLLSEAIRLGATLGPQLLGRYIRLLDHGSCAIGAAALAMGIREDWNLQKSFPKLTTHLAKDIIRLNDIYNLTREEIADYIVAHGLDCESQQQPAPQDAPDHAPDLVTA